MQYCDCACVEGSLHGGGLVALDLGVGRFNFATCRKHSSRL